MLVGAVRLSSLRRSPRSKAALGGAALTVGALALNQLLSARGKRAQAGLITVDRSITIKRVAREVYAYWRDLTHLPEFIDHLEAVTVVDGVSTWRAKPLPGVSLEWQAEIVQDREGEGFSWRSLPGSSIPKRGSVRFAKAPGGRGTEVRLHLEYEPPGGAVGAAFARLFRGLPALAFEADLRRLKQILETGEVVHSDASIRRGLHPARPMSGKFSGKVGS